MIERIWRLMERYVLERMRARIERATSKPYDRAVSLQLDAINVLLDGHYEW